MKILKKIGIGCLALVICFCSCFKFVNAETELVYLPLNEPFSLVQGNYFLVIDKVFADENNVCEVFYYNNNENQRAEAWNLDKTMIENEPDLYLEYNTPSGNYSFTLNYEFTHFQQGQDYYVYSFSVDVPLTQDLETLMSFDQYSAFITTNDIDENDNSGFSVYDTIYNLVERYIFGGNIEKGSHQDLTAVILSSIICVLVFALPFLIIWKVIKVIMG